MAPVTLQTTLIDAAVGRELLPTGKLRVGVVRAPTSGVFFVSVDDQMMPHGVTVDVASALAQSLGTDTTFNVFPNSGECTEALASGGVDVAFMPVDSDRRQKVAFGPAYYLLRSTFLIASGDSIRTIADYRERGKRFVGIADTTTLRAAIRTFGSERAIDARGVEEAMALFASGAADAVALSEDYLRVVQADHPGSIVMEETFQETSISIAVGKGKQAALDLVTGFLEGAKASGMMRQVFDRHGFGNEPVAPAGV